MLYKSIAGVVASAMLIVSSSSGSCMLAAPSGSAGKTARPVVSVGGGAPKVIANEKYVYDNDGDKLDHTLLKQQAQLGKYTMYEEIVDDLGLIKIKLSLNNKVLLEKTLPRWKGLSEASYGLYDPVTNKTCEKKPVARDINGDGIPELIVLQDDGAARGNLIYTFYQLNGSPQLQQSYQTSWPGADFRDADGDGVYEVKIGDSTLEAWHDGSTAESYVIPIILAWDGKKYVASAKYMKRKAPTTAELKALVSKLEAEIKKSGYKAPAGSKVITSSVWGEMAWLVYSGNEQSAKALFDLMYPAATVKKLAPTTAGSSYSGGAKLETREQFWQEFMAKLKTSQYAAVLGQFRG